MPRAECFIHQSSSPSRVASLGSGQENIWRPDSRLGAKVSALPSSHPPPHFTPSLLVVTGPGKIKAGHLGLESQLFSSHDLTSEPWVLHLCVCVCVCVWWWWWWWFLRNKTWILGLKLGLYLDGSRNFRRSSTIKSGYRSKCWKN